MIKKEFFSLPKPNRQNRMLAGLTIFAIFVSYLKFFYFPQYTKLRESANSIMSLKSQIESKNAILEDWNRKTSSGTIVSDSYADLERYLQSHGSVGDLLKILNQDNLPLTRNRVEIEKHEVFPEYSRTLVSVDLEASFLNLGQFLDNIERSDFLFQIQSVDISHIGHEVKKCSGKFKFYVYLARRDA